MSRSTDRSREGEDSVPDTADVIAGTSVESPASDTINPQQSQDDNSVGRVHGDSEEVDELEEDLGTEPVVVQETEVNLGGAVDAETPAGDVGPYETHPSSATRLELRLPTEIITQVTTHGLEQEVGQATKHDASGTEGEENDFQGPDAGQGEEAAGLLGTIGNYLWGWFASPTTGNDESQQRASLEGPPPETESTDSIVRVSEFADDVPPERPRLGVLTGPVADWLNQRSAEGVQRFDGTTPPETPKAGGSSLPNERRSSQGGGDYTYGEISPRRFSVLNELHRRPSLSAALPNAQPDATYSSHVSLTGTVGNPNATNDKAEDGSESEILAGNRTPPLPLNRAHTLSSPPRSASDIRSPLYSSHSLPTIGTGLARRASDTNLSSAGSTNRISLSSIVDDLPSVKLKGSLDNVEMVMTPEIADLLREHLPTRLRVSEAWHLLYSLDQHGVSMSTLYRSVKDRGPLILAIRDKRDNIFGAYVSVPLVPTSGFYGTGECFLWRVLQQSSSKSVQVRAYPWTGQNDYYISSEPHYIGIGGGASKFGLWISDTLDKGYSDTCPTFENEPLTGSAGDFECMELELWGFEVYLQSHQVRL